MRRAVTEFGTAARALFGNWPALLVFNGLYAALLIALYLFVATTEATLWQLVLTAALAVAAPVLFFTLQAAVVAHAVAGETRPARLLRQSIRNFWKLFVISLPLVLLALLTIYLLQKLQEYVPGIESSTQQQQQPAASPPPALSPQYPESAAAPPLPLRWEEVLFSALRLLLFGIAFPLAGIHLWLTTARAGLTAALKNAWRIPARAFAPAPLLVYTIGLVVFGMMPYFLIFTRTPVNGAWAELVLFGARLALAFIFTLWGWVVTLGALAQTIEGTAPDVSAPAVV